MKLTLATYGFFVLPMRGRRCAGLVVPANAVEDVAHRAELLIDGVVEASTVPGIPADRHRTTTIPLTGCRLAFGKPAPAEVSNFELILDVRDLFCQGVLKSAYATHKNADVVVEFSAGSVAAAADRHTASQEWFIGGCDGVEPGPPRRLTSLVVYSCDTWAGRIDVTRRGAPAASQYLQFAGEEVTLALRNVPIAADSSFAAVNHHHTESTKPLLSRFTEVNGPFRKRNTRPSVVPRASLSGHVASFLGMDPRGETWLRAREDEDLGGNEFPPPPVFFEGDPHCSMRTAQVPRRPLPEHIDVLPPVTAR